MKCMCAQTRPRFILSSERVFGGMEFEPMLTPRGKSPLPEMSPEEDRTRDAVDSEPKHYQLSYSGPKRKINQRIMRIIPPPGTKAKRAMEEMKQLIYCAKRRLIGLAGLSSCCTLCSAQLLSDVAAVLHLQLNEPARKQTAAGLTSRVE